MKDRKRVDPGGGKGGKEFGRVKGGENIIRIFYVINNLFSVRERRMEKMLA